MTLLDFVSHIPFPDGGFSPSTREEVLQALKTFYCRFFAEDGREGSVFDGEVLDALDAVGRAKPDCPDRHAAGPCAFSEGRCVYCWRPK